jgi:hypothetical protein
MHSIEQSVQALNINIFDLSSAQNNRGLAGMNLALYIGYVG